MKKCLLTLTAIAISIVGFGQASSHARPGSPSLSYSDYKSSSNNGSEQVSFAGKKTSTTPSLARRTSPNQNHTSTVCNVVAIGHASNALGSTGGGHTQVWYDQNLNTIVYTHRGLCGTPPTVTNTGYYVYDISTDGGSTWLADQGPIYGNQLNATSGCTVLGPHR